MITMESTFISRNPLLVIFSFIVVAVFSAHSFFPASPKRRAPLGAQATATATASPVNPFDGLNLEAKAAYVWDIDGNKALYAKKAEAQLPLASLTKIMTALVALDRAPAESIVTIQKKFFKNEGDQGLRAAERWRLKDIVEFTLVASSNDGADAVASASAASSFFAPDERGPSESSFTDSMNAKARRIGLRQTYFTNDTGLDRSEAMSGAYGSARDVARLFAYALFAIPEVLEATRYEKVKFTSLNAIVHKAENTNPLVSKIPGLIASKTGFTDLAGGNVVIAFDAGPGKPIVVSVLGSSFDGRFTDMEKLVWATLRYLQKI